MGEARRDDGTRFWFCVDCVVMYSESNIMRMAVYRRTTATMLLYSCSYAYKPFQCFKLAGIPGPKPRPIAGNLGLLRKFGVSFLSFV